MKSKTYLLLLAGMVLGLAPLARLAGDSDAGTYAKWPTAQDQSTDPKDVQVTRDVRQALVKSDLSVSAKNIIVVTRGDHTVYLSGKVASPAERRHALALAKAAAGSYKVRMFLQLNI